jgi:hypothetical protein
MMISSYIMNTLNSFIVQAMGGNPLTVHFKSLYIDGTGTGTFRD